MKVNTCCHDVRARGDGSIICLVHGFAKIMQCHHYIERRVWMEGHMFCLFLAVS